MDLALAQDWEDVITDIVNGSRRSTNHVIVEMLFKLYNR